MANTEKFALDRGVQKENSRQFNKNNSLDNNSKIRVKKFQKALRKKLGELNKVKASKKMTSNLYINYSQKKQVSNAANFVKYCEELEEFDDVFLTFEEQEKSSICLQNQGSGQAFVEENISVLAQSKASMMQTDEINYLIKKMALSFKAQKDSARFLIDRGIFAGAHFLILNRRNKLAMNVSNASKDAKALLKRNESILTNRLLRREIVLTELDFD